MQEMAFCLLKGGLLHAKRPPLAKQPEANENRKENLPECNKP